MIPYNRTKTRQCWHERTTEQNQEYLTTGQKQDKAGVSIMQHQFLQQQWQYNTTLVFTATTANDTIQRQGMHNKNKTADSGKRPNTTLILASPTMGKRQFYKNSKRDYKKTALVFTWKQTYNSTLKHIQHRQNQYNASFDINTKTQSNASCNSNGKPSAAKCSIQHVFDGKAKDPV